ncbi:MAG: glycosyltransferase family 39 protein [Thermomicrobiales bacterium]|nr:glycosyltransferase family 39 protein [Thermomicrobiales bacterium]
MTAIPQQDNQIVQRTAHAFLWLLLGLFLAKGVVIALVTEPYSGHDEIAHYSYIRILAEEGRLPLIPDLDAWREARSAGGDTSFDEIPDEFYPWAGHFTTPDWWRGQLYIPREVYGDDDQWYPSGWIYTANHPPLYYLWLTPVYWLTDGLTASQQVIFMRIATIPFGMATVLFAWLAARALFRHDLFLRILIPTFVAFQPQIAYESAIVNNDILAIMFCSAIFWMLIEGLRNGFTWKRTLAVGALYGLAILGKTNSATMGVIIAAAMIAGIGWHHWREWLPKGAAVVGTGGLLVAPWSIYMLRTYGEPTGLQRVAELQAWWNMSSGDSPTLLGQLVDPTFFWFRWKETWGEFGWRLIELDGYMADVYGIGPRVPTLLTVLLVIVIIGAMGCGVWLWRVHLTVGKGSDDVFAPQRWQWIALGTMVFACALGYYSVLQFGLTFSLTQARYYFPMIVPAAILLMLGFRSLLPTYLVRAGAAVLFLMMVVLNILIYTGWVLPYWYPAAGAALR